MKGSEKKLTQYMEGTNNRFVIPVYQRNYDWKIENCRQLYDDLVAVIFENKESHFFGSITSVYNPDGEEREYLIIDGQQRLTTVSLLFLAMHKLLEKDEIKSEDSKLSEKIMETYLIDRFQKELDTKIKLKPVKNDKEALEKLFKNEGEYIEGSNITINYRYFLERIKKQEISVDDLFKAIGRLEIIDIELNISNGDDPQLIFESLNSTGVALSEGDKIRNFMLMGLSKNQQEEYYEKYWNKIEKNTDYNVSEFIRDFLTVKQQNIPPKDKVYFHFKKYVRKYEKKSNQTEKLFKELLSYSDWWGILLKANSGNKEIDGCLSRLNRIQATVTRPFFMEVLRLNFDHKLQLQIEH